MTKLLSDASNVKSAATKGQSRLLSSRTQLQRTGPRRADTPRESTSWTPQNRSRESALYGTWLRRLALSLGALCDGRAAVFVTTSGQLLMRRQSERVDACQTRSGCGPQVDRSREVGGLARSIDVLVRWPRLYGQRTPTVRQGVRGFEQLPLGAMIVVPTGPTCGPKWSHHADLQGTFGGLPWPVVAGQRHDPGLLPAPTRQVVST
jgi:hypothetical protein